ncbi:hypothetical protein D3C85_1852120 [compost metagenome]
MDDAIPNRVPPTIIAIDDAALKMISALSTEYVGADEMQGDFHLAPPRVSGRLESHIASGQVFGTPRPDFEY